MEFLQEWKTDKFDNPVFPRLERQHVFFDQPAPKGIDCRDRERNAGPNEVQNIASILFT